MLNSNGVLADRLLEWLGEHNMTEKEFARRAGVNASTVYSIISERHTARTDTLVAICVAHGISADWLLGLR